MENKKNRKIKLQYIFSLAVLSVVVFSLCGCVSLGNIFHATLPAEQTNTDETDKKLLNVGIDLTYPPFEYVENGEAIGFDVDLAYEIAKRLDKELKFESIQWDADFKLLREGAIDLIISAVPYNADKDVIVDFSKPYFAMKYMLVSLVGSGLKTKSDLAGKRVGMLQEGKKNLDPEYISGFVTMEYKDVLELLNGLKTQDVSAILLSLPVAVNLIRENANMYSILDETFSSQEFVIVYREGSQLKAVIDSVLEELLNDGTYDEIYAKWFGLDS